MVIKRCSLALSDTAVQEDSATITKSAPTYIRPLLDEQRSGHLGEVGRPKSQLRKSASAI